MTKKTVVVAVSDSRNPSSASQRAIDWLLTDPMGIVHSSESASEEEAPRLIFLHISQGLEDEEPYLLQYAEKSTLAEQEAGLIQVECLTRVKDKFGIGHTLKAFCNETKPTMLVAGLTRKELPLYLARCDTFCPVLLIPALATLGDAKASQVLRVAASPIMRDNVLTVTTKSHRVFLSVDNNKVSDIALDWVRSNSGLRKQATLFLVHSVQQEHERQQGRAFLDSFSSVTEGDKESVLGALIDTKGQPLWMGMSIFAKASPSNGAILQIIAPSPRATFGGKVRLGGQFTTSVVTNFTTYPLLVYKDENTASEQRASTAWKSRLTRARSSSVISPTRRNSLKSLSPRFRRSYSLDNCVESSPILMSDSSSKGFDHEKMSTVDTDEESIKDSGSFFDKAKKYLSSEKTVDHYLDDEDSDEDRDQEEDGDILHKGNGLGSPGFFRNRSKFFGGSNAKFRAIGGA